MYGCWLSEGIIYKQSPREFFNATLTNDPVSVTLASHYPSVGRRSGEQLEESWKMDLESGNLAWRIDCVAIRPNHTMRVINPRDGLICRQVCCSCPVPPPPARPRSHQLTAGDGGGVRLNYSSKEKLGKISLRLFWTKAPIWPVIKNGWAAARLKED